LPALFDFVIEKSHPAVHFLQEILKKADYSHVFLGRDFTVVARSGASLTPTVRIIKRKPDQELQKLATKRRTPPPKGIENFTP
jgi:hypothetical protein